MFNCIIALPAREYNKDTMTPRKMKFITFLIAFVVILVILVFAKIFWPTTLKDKEEKPASEEKIENGISQKELPDVKTTNIFVDIELYEVDVSYPQFSGGDADWALERINKEVIRDVENKVEDFSSVVGGSTFLPDVKSSYSISFEVMGNAGRDLLSVVFTISDYAAGAVHPNTVVYTRTFNLNTGDDVLITEFVEGPSPYETLASTARVKLREHPTIQEFGLAKDDWIFDGSAPNSENYETFVVDGDYLIIYFNPYQVAPYAAGVIEISIPLPR